MTGELFPLVVDVCEFEVCYELRLRRAVLCGSVVEDLGALSSPPNGALIFEGQG